MIGAFIVCENCGTADFYSLVPKSWITKWARVKGWSIGKQHLCPDCRKNKKSAGGGRLIIKAVLPPTQKEEQRHENTVSVAPVYGEREGECR